MRLQTYKYFYDCTFCVWHTKKVCVGSLGEDLPGTTNIKREIVRTFKKLSIEKDVKTSGLTEPVFILHISESIFVVTPVAIEIHIAIFSSLKHLKYYKTGYST